MSRKVSRIAMIAMAACAFALPLALLGCGGSQSTTQSEGTQAQESKADDAQTSEEDADVDATKTDEANPIDADQHAPVPEDETDESYRAQWEDRARSFLTIYPANHVRTSVDEEPMNMTIEDWASNCLSYLDPDCELARALQNDPESIAVPLSYYEVAQVVNSTEVVATDDTSVTVAVTEEATQQNWEQTTEIVRTFRVTFGDQALITGVEELA